MLLIIPCKFYPFRKNHEKQTTERIDYIHIKWRARTTNNMKQSTRCIYTRSRTVITCCVVIVIFDDSTRSKQYIYALLGPLENRSTVVLDVLTRCYRINVVSVCASVFVCNRSAHLRGKGVVTRACGYATSACAFQVPYSFSR